MNFQVVTNLRGRTHSALFTEAIQMSSGAPAHVSVDRALAWGGVRAVMELIYGDANEVSTMSYEGEVFQIK